MGNINNFEFTEPWHRATEDDNCLVEQLNAELPEGHVLFGKKLELIARRFDQDEILVKDEYTYAVVHLTWGEPSVNTPQIPETAIYNSIEEAVKESL